MYTTCPLFWIFESARFVDCTTFELCCYSIDYATVNSLELLYATLQCLSVSFNYMYNSNCIGQLSTLNLDNRKSTSASAPPGWQHAGTGVLLHDVIDA